MALPPAEVISPATASAASAEVFALMTTMAPAFANSSAMARPILRELPVTMAAVPLRSPGSALVFMAFSSFALTGGPDWLRRIYQTTDAAGQTFNSRVSGRVVNTTAAAIPSVTGTPVKSLTTP